MPLWQGRACADDPVSAPPPGMPGGRCSDARTDRHMLGCLLRGGDKLLPILGKQNKSTDDGLQIASQVTGSLRYGCGLFWQSGRSPNLRMS